MLRTTENILHLPGPDNRTAFAEARARSTARRAQFYGRVLEEVRALPGVQEAAYATGLPMAMRGGIWPVSLKGEEVVPDKENSVSLRYRSPRYFAALGIPFRRGRDLAETDRGEPFVAVVSESFVKRSWPNENPLGKRFSLASSERTVVGVVGDVRVRGLERESEPQVYLPYAQVPDGAIIGYTPKDLVVRTVAGLPAESLLPRIREIVKSADPEQPIANVRAMSEIVAEETASRVTQLRLLGALSGVALLIAGLGIHGLLAFSVSKRSQELGVRRALGAQAGEIVGLVVREGLTLALCLATAVVGCLRPALRAAHVDPLTALRAE